MIEKLPQLAPLVKYYKFGDFHTFEWGDLGVHRGYEGKYFADPGEARGCSTNAFVIN